MSKKLLFKMSLGIKAISKGRPRAAKGGHFYTPPRTREYERQVREAAEVMMLRPPAECPVHLIIHIEVTPPTSWPKWKKEMAQYISPKKGDLDNKVKAISDALNGIAFVDDVQINWLEAQMQYGSDNRVFVELYQNGMTEAEAKGRWHEQNNKGSARVGG
jgi:Holliday junction resolvase RusA-like endonuclease